MDIFQRMDSYLKPHGEKLDESIDLSENFTARRKALKYGKRNIWTVLGLFTPAQRRRIIKKNNHQISCGRGFLLSDNRD